MRMVEMTTAIIRPTSDQVAALSTFGAGTGNYGRVNESSTNDTNGLTTESSSGATDRYGMGDLSLSGTITSVTAYIRGWCEAPPGSVFVAASCQMGVYIGSTGYYSEKKTLSTRVANLYKSWATNPATEAAWTWEDINALQMLLKLTGGTWITEKNNGPFAAYASQAWIEITYSLPTLPTFIKGIMRHNIMSPFIIGGN